MTLYSSPPPARPFSDTKPILLTSWWITVFCAAVIVIRLLGRFVRVERLFREDIFAAAALIPLFMRMGFVHPILVSGTNNVSVGEVPLSDDEIHHRSVASRLVLVTRILYPAILWLLKVVTLEFFGRLVGITGTKSYTILLHCIRATLAITFLAVIIADLAECHPLTQYWQVVPDPGGQCRQGYVHLLTLTVCNVLTDILLIVFPVPIVAKSRLSMGRKTLLVGLLCLHVFTVIVAIYPVPAILREDGYQGTRTMWASVEILMATFAANALAIGTFVRDTGVKKNRFRYRPNTEVDLGSTHRDPAAVLGKKASWLGHDSNGEMERGRRRSPSALETNRKGPQESGNLARPIAAADGKDGVSQRTESLDSLIPRSRSSARKLNGGVTVTKTTTIEVKVHQGPDSVYRNPEKGIEGLTARPADVADKDRTFRLAYFDDLASLEG
ncbi:hypothetical protein N0V88_007076 [Collariella sp. IMI 366227]|nr:hypothetical protein N0V88_007076 [Collariella sp. IMI 366227]